MTCLTLKKKMREYCQQDVEILKKGCLAFKEQIMNLTENKCDPFQYFTLASVAAAIYRGQFLKEKTIAAVPPNGYASHQRYSSKSLEWLEWLRRMNGCNDLKHIGNSAHGECSINSLRFDGVEIQKKLSMSFMAVIIMGVLLVTRKI